MLRVLRPALAALLVACGESVDLGGTTADASLDARQGDAGGESCTNLAPPTTKAPCDGCSVGSKGCQANGCFNGYLCDISERDCKTPGTSCSSTVKFDAK